MPYCGFFFFMFIKYFWFSHDEVDTPKTTKNFFFILTKFNLSKQNIFPDIIFSEIPFIEDVLWYIWKWMDGHKCFCDWFESFCGFIKDLPLLLLHDRHLSHISLYVVQFVLKENGIILKFLPQVTDADVLQPLDVSCFGPIKIK